MTSRSEGSHVRTYIRDESIVFLKTKEKYGGLSNMASGFPLRVCGLDIRTAEALYQACRFPRSPDVQRLILDEKSPMAAKMRSKPYRPDSRRDWDLVRVKIMRWCLHVKLAQNWSTFSHLLNETVGSPIVEESRRDPFWGARPTGDRMLVGMNVLGRLLMELRDEVVTVGYESLRRVEPLAIDDFLLDGQPIGDVTSDEAPAPDGTAEPHRAGAGPRGVTGPAPRKGRRRDAADQIPLDGWLLPGDDE